MCCFFQKLLVWVLIWNPVAPYHPRHKCFWIGIASGKRRSWDAVKPLVPGVVTSPCCFWNVQHIRIRMLQIWCWNEACIQFIKGRLAFYRPVVPWALAGELCYGSKNGRQFLYEFALEVGKYHRSFINLLVSVYWPPKNGSYFLHFHSHFQNPSLEITKPRNWIDCLSNSHFSTFA